MFYFRLVKERLSIKISYSPPGEMCQVDQYGQQIHQETAGYHGSDEALTPLKEVA